MKGVARRKFACKARIESVEACLSELDELERRVMLMELETIRCELQQLSEYHSPQWQRIKDKISRLERNLGVE